MSMVNLDGQGSGPDLGVKHENLMGQDLDPSRRWMYRCLCSVPPPDDIIFLAYEDDIIKRASCFARGISCTAVLSLPISESCSKYTTDFSLEFQLHYCNTALQL